MAKEKREICFDESLQIEAYYFEGILQPFPNHFHEHYVIGFIEKGRRKLTCNKEVYQVNAGELLLFNPFDNHACVQEERETLTYRCLNINPHVMRKIVKECNGESYLPVFKNPVMGKCDLLPSLKELHLRILRGEKDFKKEELFYFFMEQLIKEFMERPVFTGNNEEKNEIKRVAQFLQSNYDRTITLNELSEFTSTSKYHLLHTFTLEKGISPYRYLENVRISEAKKRLEEGCSIAETALQTGFTDQSHFTNFFKKFIGLTPKQYQNIFNKTK